MCYVPSFVALACLHLMDYVGPYLQFCYFYLFRSACHDIAWFCTV